MTVTIDLTPEQEAAIKKQAELQGITLEAWVKALVEQEAPPDSIAHLMQTDPEAWFRQFRELVYRHPGSGRPLAADAFDRESIYEDRY
jgi:hypothetical protein